MKKKTLLLVFVLLLLSSYSYAYDCRGFLGTWDVTTTFESGSQGHVVWVFTEATQDVALGYNENTASSIQVTWSDSKGQYRLFYPQNSSMGDAWISLLNDTLTGYTDLSSIGRVTFNGTKRPGTGPTTTTTSILQTTTTSILHTTTTTTIPEGNACAASNVLEDDDESLDLLRQFRDERLMNTEQGKRFVELYYKYSPAVC